MDIDISGRCLPINYVELALNSGEQGESGGKLKGLKVLRMFRLAKCEISPAITQPIGWVFTHVLFCLLFVGRMLRVFRVKSLIKRYEETIRPMMSAMRVSVTIVGIFLIAHVMGCLWYLTGTGTQVCEPL